MSKFGEEGTSKPRYARRWHLGPVSRVVNAKKNFLKGIVSATSVNTRMIRKWNSLIAGAEKVSVSG